MDKLSLYKEFYFFEIKRKGDLDGAVSIPVLSISSLIALNLYYIKEDPLPFTGWSTFFNTALLGTIIISIFLIAKSFFNSGKSNTYREVNEMTLYYEFDQSNIIKGTPEHFEIYLEKEFADCASHNFNVNRKRTESLAQGKKWLFSSIIITLFTTLYFITNVLYQQNQIQIEMAKKETKPTASTKAVTADTIQGPVSVYIQNSKNGKTVIIKGDIKKIK